MGDNGINTECRDNHIARIHSSPESKAKKCVHYVTST